MIVNNLFVPKGTWCTKRYYICLSIKTNTMNPLTINQYGANPNLFTAFAGNKFVGWLKQVGETWEARPANQWKVSAFTTKAKAVRYLIASTTK